MNLVVNGEPLEVAAECSVSELLAVLQKAPAQVAVEHNGEILERRAFADVRLRAGDRVEILHLVGGG